MKERKMINLRLLSHLLMMNRLEIQRLTLKIIVKVLIKHKEEVHKTSLFQKTTIMIKDKTKFKVVTLTHNNQHSHLPILKKHKMKKWTMLRMKHSNSHLKNQHQINLQNKGMDKRYLYQLNKKPLKQLKSKKHSKM